LIFNPGINLDGVLRSAHRILFWPKQVLLGFYLKENWKKRQPVAVYHCDVGQAMNLVG